MAIRYILTDYVNHMMAQAVYDKLEDGTFSGRIPPCKRRDFIRRLRKFGFDGPYSGTRHQWMMIREIEEIIGCDISADEWYRL